MTEPDNVICARFNMKEECERHWKDGCEIGLKFGYRYGYGEGRRDRHISLCDFAMRCLFVYIVACVLIYLVSVVAVLVLDFSRSDVAQEMVRVHDMREAYWR